MNIPKAIELNEEAIKSLKRGKFHDHADAVALGNEALYRVIERREKLSWKFEPLLPSETDKSDSP